MWEVPESREIAPLAQKTVLEVPDLEEFVDLVPHLMEPSSVLCATSAYKGFCGPPREHFCKVYCLSFHFPPSPWFRLVVRDSGPLVLDKDKNYSFPLDHRFNLTDTPELTKSL